MTRLRTSRKPAAAGSAEAGRRRGNVRDLNYATSPLLASKTPPWRSRALVALVGLAFSMLVGRAAYIQIIGTDFYQAQGEKRYAHVLDLPSSRGRILDRNGLVLATSVSVPSIWAIPKDFEADVQQRKALARLLGISPAQLQQRLDGNRNFAWLDRQVDEALWDEVKALGIKGVHQVAEYRRQYPEGESAAHVVGFTNIEDKGLEGIELAFQSQLQGRDGSRAVVKDRLGRVVEDIGEATDAVDGHDVRLAIDSKVQFFAYQRLRDAIAEHGAKAGSVVVLDARNGQVLALANYPSYDPGDRRTMSAERVRNRALTDTFEPGSTMKPFTIALALQTGRVTPQTMIQTAPGYLTIGGATIHDSHAHGLLSVEQVIQKSSNVGTTRIAMQMKPREMWEMFSAVGLGQKPQLDFPGAVTGRLRPYKSWRPIEQATMSYGYGLSASLFQLARAYTAFSNDGELLPASMLYHDALPVGVRVFSKKTAREVRKMLQLAAGPGGTAPKAQALGYSVGGKTGTAHKQEGRGYAANKYRAWFVGMAPIGEPRIIVGVMIDEPGKGSYYGGDVAAPVFSQVVQQTLRTMGVPPDIAVTPQIADDKSMQAEPENF